MSISRSFSSLLLPGTVHPLLKQKLVICSQMPCDTSVYDWFSHHLGCGLPVWSGCALPILPKFVSSVNFLGILLTSGANVTDENLSNFSRIPHPNQFPTSGSICIKTP